MRTAKAELASNKATLQLFMADNWWLRLRGLLGRPALTSQQAMLIAPCHSVHTLGMRYSIDVVYLNKDYQVLKVVENLHPGRFSACKGARYTIELSAGAVQRYQIYPGETIKWSI
ncbi:MULTISPECIES: DUF192 domain-containing protein [Alkalimonas]|uniref:DUF192 domain-containing protein n=1 Tax=Alkalimonas mucilaginosa TaxID=3057676 RepID=A0ABU7JJ95_9GAMM|nr:DUF192 domain-containing protein [Alkalimonas sp. MEB004]MEE2025769.1 DUF192 domain-containing protein [Alkalimonas sp. MEB004]